jgi:hypothetical protein
MNGAIPPFGWMSARMGVGFAGLVGRLGLNGTVKSPPVDIA